MPKKKRTPNFKQYQGSSSAGQDGGDSPTATVNERLNDLRLSTSFEAVQKKRDLAEQSGQKSVPPELRSILGVPESAPPKPKVGVRVRDREMQRERWRTPGPAAPRSWLGFTSAWAGALVERRGRRRGKQGGSGGDADRRRPEVLFRFEKLVELTEMTSKGNVRSRPHGLLHLTMKRLAEHWHEFDEEDYPALVDIPLRLRLTLLSYLGIYGPSIDITALQALLVRNEAISTLDLAGLAGHGLLTIKKLARLFEPVRQIRHSANAALLDSWDAESTIDAPLAGTALQSIPTFTSLTHLCLSHPPPTAAWRDLLSLSKQTPQLSHLSLAYWPKPTLTPNLTTTTVTSQHSPDVRAGGTHYYSHSLDNDFSEAALLLRQLSGNLLSLHWLDLEGCTEWIPALATLAVEHKPENRTEIRQAEDGWHGQTVSSAASVFNDTWRNLSYLRVAQPTSQLPKALGIAGLDPTNFVDPEIRSPLLRYLHCLGQGG
ncbi:hypothetical protein EJ03DRAFT_381867 [Teratosphaeria nubilosa]|uniref:Uncharacterized protein n=1 Tax=Teratosphaeria nubilosa TaxID=161662 RepID=A0A6G1LDG4_9PEZI|nr:hypothetical protein EJ03DRAFT_381867 [Teratosphaeria nubilosa]